MATAKVPLPRVWPTVTRTGLGVFLYALLLGSWAAAAPGQLELSVIDATSGEPIAVQLQLFNQRQRVVRPPQLVRDGDWLVFDGRTVLTLPPGRYTFRLQRGLEYRERTGHFVLESGAADHQEVALPRFVTMADEGWRSGDLHVAAGALPELPLKMLAADLDVVPAIGWDASGPIRANRLQDDTLKQAVGPARSLTVTAGADRRTGSCTLFFGLEQPLALPAETALLPSPFEIAQSARQEPPNAAHHVHLTHVTAQDLPVWIALGLVDSVGLLHDGLRGQSSVEVASDRPLDPVLFPPPAGVGRWSQQVYFRLLETGLRLPPAAGSGANRGPNPLGYHRVYVHCGDKFSPAAWWEGLRAGRVLLSNGPLLRPLVNGQLPGHVFRAQAGQRVELEVALQLSTRDKIQYLELIQNGRPIQQVRLEDWAREGGRLPPVVFEQSGWFLVRAVAEDPDAYRAAVSGPYYVELDDQPRISRAAVQFFLDWVYQRARTLAAQRSDETRAVLEPHRQARDFWQRQLARANAD